MSTDMTYRSYAKINLYLDVLNRRRDGYHNIETIFQTVSLCDELHFAEAHNRISLSCTTQDLDTGEDNLVYRAAMLLREHAGVTQGARIHLDKHIPIAAGMAGGSGNAAATLIALNTLWGLRWPAERLRGLALQLGSDVPYCTMGGTALATRRGEDLQAMRPIRKTWFVLVHPEIAVSAARTYNHPKLTRNDAPCFAGRTAGFRKAIGLVGQGDWAAAVYNSMEAAVFHDFPNLAAARDRLLEHGCTAAAMSGSGPTIFGVCASKRDATRIAEKMEALRTSVVHTVPLGVERVR